MSKINFTPAGANFSTVGGYEIVVPSAPSKNSPVELAKDSYQEENGFFATIRKLLGSPKMPQEVTRAEIGGCGGSPATDPDGPTVTEEETTEEKVLDACPANELISGEGWKGNSGGADVSHDGRYVAFSSRGPEGGDKRQIYVRDRLSKALVQVTDRPYNCGPQVSADGTKVLYWHHDEDPDCDLNDYQRTRLAEIEWSCDETNNCEAEVVRDHLLDPMENFVNRSDVFPPGGYQPEVHEGFAHRISPDGNVVILDYQLQYRSNGVAPFLFRLDLKTEESRLIGVDTISESLSYDGNLVAYSSPYMGEPDVLLYNHAEKRTDVVSITPSGDLYQGRCENPYLYDNHKGQLMLSYATPFPPAEGTDLERVHIIVRDLSAEEFLSPYPTNIQVDRGAPVWVVPTILDEETMLVRETSTENIEWHGSLVSLDRTENKMKKRMDLRFTHYELNSMSMSMVGGVITFSRASGGEDERVWRIWATSTCHLLRSQNNE